MNARRALIAILLLAPVPSFGIAAAVVWWPGQIGQAIFSFCKLWLLFLPAFWFFVIDKKKLQWSAPRRRHLPIGVATGVVGGLAVVLAYLFIALPRIDPAALRATTTEIGIGSPVAYIAGALYWIMINSLIEEYVFRWFLLKQAERLVAPMTAVLISSSVFTAHHIIALNAYLEPMLTFLASAGIFIGGSVWCWIYLRVRSLWPCWLSHALIDAAVFAVGYHIVFGF